MKLTKNALKDVRALVKIRAKNLAKFDALAMSLAARFERVRETDRRRAQLLKRAARWWANALMVHERARAKWPARRGHQNSLILAFQRAREVLISYLPLVLLFPEGVLLNAALRSLKEHEYYVLGVIDGLYLFPLDDESVRRFTNAYDRDTWDQAIGAAVTALMKKYGVQKNPLDPW